MITRAKLVIVLAGAPLPTPVLGARIIGYSVQHRPLIAYHFGNPHARRTALILGEMHGDEPAGVTLARSIVMAAEVSRQLGSPHR